MDKIRLILATEKDAELLHGLQVEAFLPLYEKYQDDETSPANGLMIDTMQTYGADSLVGRMSCVARGASDTTFYILAVYFGSVGISKTRNAVTCGLIADFSGIIAAIIISYLFFT